MKKILFATLISVGVVEAGIAGLRVGNSPANIDDLPPKAEMTSPEAKAVEQRVLAAQLAAYGLQANDPVALIAAARITQAVPTQDKLLEKKPEVGDKKEEVADKKTGVDLQSVEFLLGKARELSSGDQTILALAKSVPESSSKGAIGSCCGTGGNHRSRIQANASDTYYNQWTFKGGESTRMAVIGDGDTDLDCYVYDGNGNLVDYDDDGTDRCVLAWTPRQTGPFSLKIVNNGGTYNRYAIIWN